MAMAENESMNPPLEPEMLARLNAAEDRLSTWEVAYRAKMPDIQGMWPTEIIQAAKVAQNLTPNDPRESVFELIDELADQYLGSNASMRDRIRLEVAQRRHVEAQLLPYVGRCAEHVRAERDRRWLRRGLAGASIEDHASDFRDTYGYLWDLYRAAEAAGISPSSDFIWSGPCLANTRHPVGFQKRQIVEFEQSAFFADMRRKQQLH
jgi:hypothetical protein